MYALGGKIDRLKTLYTIRTINDAIRLKTMYYSVNNKLYLLTTGLKALFHKGLSVNSLKGGFLCLGLLGLELLMKKKVWC